MVKRVDYLDNLGGLLICYMMLNHIILRGQIACTVDCVYLEPLQFFMFWFFYKSGMFYKPKDYRKIVLRGGNKLLVPWIVFAIIGHVVKCLQLFVNKDYDWKHYVLTPIKEIVCTGGNDGNQPLWFLFSLFLVQLVFNAGFQKKIRPCVMAVCGIMVATFLFMTKGNLPIYFSNVSLGIAFYALGYILRESQFGKQIFSLSLAFYLAIMVFCPSHLILRSNTLNQGGYYLLALIFSLAGCVLFNNFFRRLPSCIFLQYIGKHSMAFYVMHWIVLNLCMMIFAGGLHLPGIYVFGIMVIACLILPYLMEKIIDKCQKGWLLGKNN